MGRSHLLGRVRHGFMLHFCQVLGVFSWINKPTGLAEFTAIKSNLFITTFYLKSF